MLYGVWQDKPAQPPRIHHRNQIWKVIFSLNENFGQ
jgi:hypothetical protein